MRPIVSKTVMLALMIWTLHLNGVVRGAAPPPQIDSGAVDKLIARIAGPDVSDGNRAEAELEDSPFGAQPLIEKVLKRDDLASEVKERVARLLKRRQGRQNCATHLQELRAEGTKWIAKNAMDDYERDGHSNPAWDAHARNGIGLFQSGRLNADRNELRKSLQEFNAAFAAGCDDPSLLVLAGLLSNDTGGQPSDTLNYFIRGDKASADGKIGPYFKAVIDGRIIRGYGSGYGGGVNPQNAPLINRYGHDICKQFLALAATPGVPIGTVTGVETSLLAGAKAVHADQHQVFNETYPAMEKIDPNNAEVLVIKGQFYLDYAWEARGNGLANTVTPQGAKDFADRLEIASDALTRAWKADPLDPAAATLMLTVETGQGNGRPVMEKWFARAMQANPDNLDACNQKMYYLEPKWYGSPQEMLDFGHLCVDEGNYKSRIPLELLDAHQTLAIYSQNEPQYYARAAVWADIQLCCTNFLDRYPHEDRQRSIYARMACLCQQWQTADEQFKKLGDKLVVNVFKSPEELKSMRDQANTRQNAELN